MFFNHKLVKSEPEPIHVKVCGNCKLMFIVNQPEVCPDCKTKLEDKII